MSEHQRAGDAKRRVTSVAVDFIKVGLEPQSTRDLGRLIANCGMVFTDALPKRRKMSAAEQKAFFDLVQASMVLLSCREERLTPPLPKSIRVLRRRRFQLA